MGQSKIIPALPVIIEPLQKHSFFPNEIAVTYAGRAILVLSIATLAYLAFKKRKSIYNTCLKVVTYFKPVASSEAKLSVVSKKAGLEFSGPLNVNVHVHSYDSSTEGKESDSENDKHCPSPRSVPSKHANADSSAKS